MTRQRAQLALFIASGVIVLLIGMLAANDVLNRETLRYFALAAAALSVVAYVLFYLTTRHLQATRPRH